MVVVACTDWLLVGDWDKFCRVFAGGGYVLVGLFFFFYFSISYKTHKKKTSKVQEWVKTKKKKIHNKEHILRQIFSPTLSHTLKWWNCHFKHCSWRIMKVLRLKRRYATKKNVRGYAVQKKLFRKMRLNFIYDYLNLLKMLRSTFHT